MTALLNKIAKLESLVETGRATMEQEVEFNILIEQFETKYL